MEKNVFENLLQPVTPLIEETAASLNSQNNDGEKFSLSFLPFTVNILFAIVNRIKSVGKLVTEIKTSNVAETLGLVTASKSMYSEAFVRYDPNLYRIIFYNLLTAISFLGVPELKSLGQILLVDGSLFPAISTMQWASYKKTANAIKMHLAYSLNQMVPVEFLIREGNYSEKKFLSTILQKGITYVCDRGYISFKIFKQICDQGAFFIIRGKNKMCYAIQEYLVVDIPNDFLQFITKIQDIKVIFDNDKDGNSYRIVIFTALKEQYVLITNRFDLTTYQIIMLYAYRWQIELFFRFIKRTLKGIHLLAHNSNGIQIQFYLYMIAHLLLLAFKQECQKIKQDAEVENVSRGSADTENRKTRSGSAITKDASGRVYVRGLVSLLGDKLRTHWKFGLHWMIALKNKLLNTFDADLAIELCSYT